MLAGFQILKKPLILKLEHYFWISSITICEGNKIIDITSKWHILKVTLPNLGEDRNIFISFTPSLRSNICFSKEKLFVSLFSDLISKPQGIKHKPLLCIHTWFRVKPNVQKNTSHLINIVSLKMTLLCIIYVLPCSHN